MLNVWLLTYFIVAAADWMAVWHGWRRVSYLTKPAALVFLVVWFGAVGRFDGSQALFGLGLCFSLLGDVFLMLPRRFFMAGMAAFLCAHLAYIVYFNQSLPQATIAFWVLALTLAGVWLLIFGLIRLALKQSSLHRRMLVPVGVYSVVIALMLFSAMLTLFRPEWQLGAALPAAAGGLLFFASDTMLAVDRFVQPFKRARFWVRITYHVAQLALAAGALLHAGLIESR
jgi:uncharacterized membrane protein YhhN